MSTQTRNITNERIAIEEVKKAAETLGGKANMPQGILKIIAAIVGKLYRQLLLMYMPRFPRVSK